MELKQEYVAEVEPRIRKLALGMVLVVLFLFCRIFYLQVIRGAFYRFFSEENSIREVSLPAPRGILSDRRGVILADNRAAFDLVMVPQYVVEPSRVFKTLQENLNISETLLSQAWEKRKQLPSFTAIPILEDISQDIVSWIKVHKSPWGQLNPKTDLRGIDIRLRYVRAYPEGEIASHVLGYVREIDAERLKRYQKKWPGRYQLGDAIGLRGIEEIWDLEVRGEDGFLQKVVNAVGREVTLSGLEEELIQKQALPGRHLQLTLDARLQKIARNFFAGKKGAVVALHPKDGAVLLLYSAPSFDLNRLAGRLDESYWREIVGSPKKYLLNRAIQGAYPPGSVYKIVTATAALQGKKVQPSQGFYCRGVFPFGSRSFHCWRKSGHGLVSFPRGLIASCDIYFYNLGLKAGIEGLAKYAKAFGLGQLTGIGLPGERSGLVPTPEWKQKVFGSPWAEGETLSAAIGQGANLVTPLQAAVMIATIANGGKRVTPYLVAGRVDSGTGEVSPFSDKRRAQPADLNPEVLKSIYAALVGVVASPEGTAHRLSTLGIPMGGKTGTAQVISLGKGCVGEVCKDHAWFVAFAPAEDPQIALAVLVEHGGHGSSGAAPLAGELIKTYLKDEKENL